MPRVKKPPTIDVLNVLTYLGVWPPRDLDEELANLYEVRVQDRLYDRSSSNFKAVGWWVEVRYYAQEPNWGSTEKIIKIGLPDSEFDKFQQSTLP